MLYSQLHGDGEVVPMAIGNRPSISSISTWTARATSSAPVRSPKIQIVDDQRALRLAVQLIFSFMTQRPFLNAQASLSDQLRLPLHEFARIGRPWHSGSHLR